MEGRLDRRGEMVDFAVGSDGEARDNESEHGQRDEDPQVRQTLVLVGYSVCRGLP